MDAIFLFRSLRAVGRVGMGAPEKQALGHTLKNVTLFGSHEIE